MEEKLEIAFGNAAPLGYRPATEENVECPYSFVQPHYGQPFCHETRDFGSLEHDEGIQN